MPHKLEGFGKSKYTDLEGHPLQHVPQDVLDTARSVMADAAQWDVDQDLAPTIADSIVSALAQKHMLRPVEADYPKAEWQRDVDQSGWGTSGYIAEVGVPFGAVITPEALVQRYNDLVDELTLLRTRNSGLIDCIKHVDLAIRAAQHVLGKEMV
jgi:hypothetical protein